MIRHKSPGGPNERIELEEFEALRAELRSRAERSLGSFIRQAWQVVEPGTPFMPGWHLDAVVSHLEAVTRGQIRNLLINLPPRHCKSLSVCVFWPTWEWISFPQRRWLFSSYALSLSVRDSLKCRRLLQSSWFRARWGSRFSLTKDQNEKLRFENTRGGHRIATSVNAAATGEGGDRVVVDDPHRVAERESDVARTAALRWWDQTMSTRLNDPRTGARVIVMQRIHEADLSGHVLQQGGYVHLLLPAEFEPHRRCVTPIGWSDPRTNEGALLWPQRVGPAQIAEARLRLGSEGYCGQFQQRPAPTGGGRFRAEWFMYYRKLTGPPEAYELFERNGASRKVDCSDCFRFAVMDPAGAEKDQTNDPCYTVIQVWDVTKKHEMLLIEQFRGQVSTPRAAEEAIRLSHFFDVAFIAVEKDGIGLGVVQTIRASGVTVKPIKARGSKEARSQTAEIRMAAGLIFFPHGAPFVAALEDELLHFPRGRYADQVDALAYAAMEVQRQGGAPGAEKDADSEEEDLTEAEPTLIDHV